MFKHILVTLDGSKLSEGVLPYAVALTMKPHAEITLLSVVPHHEELSKGKRQTDYITGVEKRSRAAAEEYLQTVGARLRQKGLIVNTVTEVGNEPQVIVSYAEKEKYDLLAMSTRGRTGIARWMMGSVADHVLQTSSTPLLLIKPDEKQDTSSVAIINNLVVPLDGSALAESVLPYVEELAQRESLSVVLVQALPTLSQLYLGMEPQAFPTNVMEAVEESATSYLLTASSRLNEKGIKTRWECQVGEPSSVIVELAKRTENSIVAMSTRGRTGVARWLLGSVADKVVRSAPGPVLLIRPQQGQLR